MSTVPKTGTIAWADLTVEEADRVRDFYAAVAGWQIQPVAMGEYSDYCMADASGTPIAGVCHRRGANSDLPAAWLVYIVVENLDLAMAACREQGGEIVSGPRAMDGKSRFCVVRDPAGAVAALYQAG